MGRRVLLALVLALVAFGSGCSGGEKTLTVYSGREKELVEPVIKLFEKESGVDVEVRYAGTAELAATILEEGDNSPADVFWAQDAGALGAVAKDGRFAKLTRATLSKVLPRFRSPQGLWIGTSGRARVLSYHRTGIKVEDLPPSVLELAEPEWRDRLGWAPTNGSFQAFVTALRKVEGDEKALAWLKGMKANGTKEYNENSAIVRAVAAGEIDGGLVNHYYALELGAEDETIRRNVRNYYFGDGDVGGLVNAAGVGILKTAASPDNAQRFVDFLLSREGEQYFDEEVYEYPVVVGAKVTPRLPPLKNLVQPDIDLSDLDDLQGTLAMLREAGVL